MAELNIAIADDNRQTLEMLGEILESEKDYHVVGKADNGNEAYNMIMRTKPDVVLLDIVMPGMDGISVMEKVKKQLLPYLLCLKWRPSDDLRSVVHLCDD